MSGTVTWNDCVAMMDDAVQTLERIRRWGDDGIITYLAAQEQAAKGNYTPRGIADWTASIRASFSSMVNGARALAIFQPILYEFGTVIDSPYVDLPYLVRDLYDYMKGNSISVPSRAITFGTITAGGSNVGNGTINRLTVDWNALALEACRPELKKFVCRQDQNSGVRRHAEAFEVYGTQQSLDSLELLSYGTGPLGLLYARHAGGGEGGSMLYNSSFSSFDGSDFPGWTKLSGTAPVQDTGTYYRSYPGAAVDASMKFTAAAKMSQAIEDYIPGGLDPNTPYFLRIMFNADGGGVGTLALNFGGVTKSVADVDATSGWNELKIDLNEDCWPVNFNEEGLTVEIDWQGTGEILVDDVILCPFTLVDGSYWAIVGGTTPFLRNDVFTFTDSDGDPAVDGGLLNYWFYIAGLGYLPHDNDLGTATWSDPTIT